MGSAGAFVEDFLLARQFAELLILVVQDQPETELHGWLHDAPVTVFLPTDTGLALTAAELGWQQPDKALHFLIAQTATRLGLDPRQAMRQVALAHVSPGGHALPPAGRATRLRTLDSSVLQLSVAGLGTPSGTCNLLIGDQICDNGVVHVIARPILAFAPEARRPAPARPQVVQPQVVPRLVIDAATDTFRFQL